MDGTSTTIAVDRTARDPVNSRSFLLTRVQPALSGLMDGSLSTLATHRPLTAFFTGAATALGAGVSMAFSEGLSDTGDLTGRGTQVIAFLGTGRMGGPMAANLARAGFPVRAWDRTASQAAALVPDGATVAASPAEAVRGARIVITMLGDGPATDQVWPELAAAAPGVIWVQMATVGLEWTQRFAAAAARAGVPFVDAPVSGSQGPARAASLTVLASGPQELAGELAPVFAALGRATAWLGAAGNGSRAKLVLNSWLTSLTEMTAETLTFATWAWTRPRSWTCWRRRRSARRTRCRRPAPCWPATSPPRSRSSTRSRTPNSPRRPRRPAGPSSP